MDPVVESALIAAAATAVGVGGTVVVAIVGFRSSRSTNRDTIAAAHASNQATIKAAHADVRHTLDTTREGQIADLYSRAIEQLGSDKLDVRIGGIYALERVAGDSAADHPTVIEVLTAFIREHSREQWPIPESTDAPMPERTPRPDVQAALTVIGRRDTTHDRRPIDLTGANLRRADLEGAHLNGAIFRGSILTQAILTGADLTDAIFTVAHLDGVYLRHAHLNGAKFRQADLTGAHLDDADLTGAYFPYANLTSAILHRAIFDGAHLGGARLSRAWMDDTKFRHADLADANLSDATLVYTDEAEDADSEDKFISPDFTGANLTRVRFPQDAPIPEGWVRDPQSEELRRADETPGTAS